MSILNKSIRLAEMKFEVEIWDWSESSSLNYKWGVKEIVSYVRNKFLLDEGSVAIKPEKDEGFMNISYSRFGKINDGVTLNILCPSSMGWGTFSKILEKVDLTDSFKQYLSPRYKRAKMNRISELLFRIDYLVDKSTRQFKKEFLSLNQVIKKMKDLYNNMERMDDGTVDTAYFYQHFFGRVIYNFSTDTDHSKVHIYCPDNMSQELFLTILKGAGIYEEKSGYGVIDTKDLVKKRLKKSSIQKLGELKFDVEIIKKSSAMDTPSRQMKVLARTDKYLSIKEIKNVLSSLVTEYERNQKFRESHINFRYDLFKGKSLRTGEQYFGGKYTFTEEIEDRDLVYQTLVRVIHPGGIPHHLFEKLIKDMADVLR